MIGILGSGQLSQMMVQAASKLGIGVRALESSYEEPASFEKALEDFTRDLDTVVFESELLDISLLKKVFKGPRTRVVPSLSVMELVSEKADQKLLLTRLGIPTTPYEMGPQNINDLYTWFRTLEEKWGTFVLKWSKFGYDGRGVFVVDEGDEKSFGAALQSAENALKRNTRIYAEPRVKFLRELAIVSVGGESREERSEEFRSYPLVISEQKNGICHQVYGPAVRFGVHPSFESKAQAYAQQLARELPLFGSFAIEMFETSNGELWVNEIAPRVHNSGHYTQDACNEDQFGMHLLAASGKDLPEIKTRNFFAMLNLLGPPEVKGTFENLKEKLPVPQEGLFLHWYDKDQIFPGRKLGHVNVVADTREELQNKMIELKSYEENWKNFLRGLKS